MPIQLQGRCISLDSLVCISLLIMCQVQGDGSQAICGMCPSTGAGCYVPPYPTFITPPATSTTPTSVAPTPNYPSYPISGPASQVPVVLAPAPTSAPFAQASAYNYNGLPPVSIAGAASSTGVSVPANGSSDAGSIRVSMGSALAVFIAVGFALL
jgi:hypothetical protein